MPMTRLKYDFEMLTNICDEGGVTLLEDYKDKYVTRDTRIIGKCVLCDNKFDKSLNNLHKNHNFGCKTCAKIIKFDKIKNTMVEKYGVPYAAQSQLFIDKMKETTFKNYGVEYGNQSEEVKEKTRKTNLIKYGFEYSIQSEEIKEKRRISNLEKYGFENPLQREEIKEKIRQTNLEKYGVEYGLQSKEVKEKTRKTNLIKYGFEYGFQNEEVKEKIKKTNLEKYGFENPLQREEIKEKLKQTNLEKYGVEHTMQNPEIMENSIKMSYYLKDYKLPSGTIIKVQGYEHYALDELFEKENINENNIVTGCKNVPAIWYNDLKGKKHRHFVDIYLPLQNRCIEVKSTWTFQKQKEIVFLKLNAAKDLGYFYEIWVFDNNGNKVDFYN
jgi:hypothetical protein